MHFHDPGLVDEISMFIRVCSEWQDTNLLLVMFNQVGPSPLQQIRTKEALHGCWNCLDPAWDYPPSVNHQSWVVRSNDNVTVVLKIIYPHIGETQRISLERPTRLQYGSMFKISYAASWRLRQIQSSIAPKLHCSNIIRINITAN